MISLRKSVFITNILIICVWGIIRRRGGILFFPYPFVGSDESTVNSNMLVVAKV